MLINSRTLLDSHGQLLCLVDAEGSDGGAENAGLLVDVNLLETPYTVKKGVDTLAAIVHEAKVDLGRRVIVVGCDLIEITEIADFSSDEGPSLIDNYDWGTYLRRSLPKLKQFDLALSLSFFIQVTKAHLVKLVQAVRLSELHLGSGLEVDVGLESGDRGSRAPFIPKAITERA